eukprot:3214104-Ditylum_brightwellii.AAC.1
MAKVIRDGQAELAGAGMTPLIDVQGIEQVKIFIRHIRSDSQATKLVKIAVAWAQHQCGWHELILTDVNTVLPHFEVRWLRAFHKYLQRIHATIEMEDVDVNIYKQNVLQV